MKSPIKPLTPGNILHELSKTVNHKVHWQGYTMENFNSVIGKLLKAFYGKYEEVKKFSPPDYHSPSYTYVNPSCRNSVQNDIKLIEIPMMYPQIMVKLFKESKLLFSIPEFGLLYEGLVEARRHIKTLEKKSKWEDFCEDNGIDNIMYEDLSMLTKILINFTYGALCYKKDDHRRPIVRANDPVLIADYIKPYTNYISYDIGCVLIDTDEIYVKSGTRAMDVAIKTLDKTGLHYRIHGATYSGTVYRSAKGHNLKPDADK